jgi:DNA replication and repair protein RecF
MKVRRKFIGELCGFASARHDKLTNHEEKLILEYSPSFEISNTCGDEEIEKKFFDTLERNRDNEIRKGTTVVGPHRDDIDIILNGESTKVYGSGAAKNFSAFDETSRDRPYEGRKRGFSRAFAR